MLNRKECKRLALISEVSGARMTLGHAAVELGLSGRQIRRLVSRYRQLGAAGLVSGHRGKRSNNAIRSALKEEILGLVRGRYQGHGPTWVRRKLAGTHGYELSVETLRQWMIVDGLWRTRKQVGSPIEVVSSEVKGCSAPLHFVSGLLAW